MAIGLAMPLPAMSGAEPCTGSYIALRRLVLGSASPSAAEGSMPSEHVRNTWPLFELSHVMAVPVRPLDWLSFEGDPVTTLYLATETRDLVVTGHDTAFRGNVREPLSELVAKLLLMTPRPMVVCPDEISNADEVMIAYDGGLPAMRAVQMFALLGIGEGKRIHVVSIDPSQELTVRRTSGAATYLRAHGYEVEANPVASSVHPADVLKIEIADRKVGTLVMGAYGHRGFREILFGSTTSALVEDPPCPIFIYH